MSKTAKPDKSPKPTPPCPSDKPPRDTHDSPAPNPDGNNTQEEVERVPPNLKR